MGKTAVTELLENAMSFSAARETLYSKQQYTYVPPRSAMDLADDDDQIDITMGDCCAHHDTTGVIM